MKTENLTNRQLLDLMGNDASDADATAMRDILRERGVADTDQIDDAKWFELVAQAAERSQHGYANHYAAIAPDLFGPAYGIGLTEAEAIADARVWGFEGDDIRVIRITRQSFDRIRAGNPDAVELAD